MKQTLILKGKLLSLNEYINVERSNKFGAHALKKRETERVAWECKSQRIQRTDKIVDVTFQFYHKDKRGDFDNTEFYQKFIWDGFVIAGIIKNDTQDYTPKRRVFIHELDKTNPRLEIEITCEQDLKLL